jgi:DNA-binding IclR family transcriptional regulator
MAVMHVPIRPVAGDLDEDRSATLGTVARVMRLLRCFGESDGEVSIKAAADRIGLPPSTVHRLLNLMVQEGFVERSPPGPGYRVGPELLGLAGRIVARSDLRSIALPAMREIVDAFGETCVLSRYLPETRQIMPVLSVDCPHPLRYLIELYRPAPTGWGAAGRSVLAYLPRADIDAVHQADERSPANGSALPPRDVFDREMAEIRARGYAFTLSQRILGAVGVAAPLRTKTGRLIGSIGVMVPEQRFRRGSEREIGVFVKSRTESLLPLLSDAAARAPQPPVA